MPDAGIAQGFLQTARQLSATGAVKKPTQANLRRCISTCYYAVFHALAKTMADVLVGTNKENRPNKAWVEVYRGLGHGDCLQACKRAQNIPFPDELKDFANAFQMLMHARENADYNPLVRPTKEQAVAFCTLAEESIEKLRSVSANDRRAFAAWVLITSPGAQKARSRNNSKDPRDITWYPKNSQKRNQSQGK